jgi:AraC-like DNA-binding protein
VKGSGPEVAQLHSVGAVAVGGPGDVRMAPIRAIPALLTEFGVQPRRAFDRAGVDPAALDDPEHRLPLEAVGRLLRECVELTGCPHFGLLVGERAELTVFGVLGYLVRNCPTVGDALRNLVRYLYVHDRGATPMLFEPAAAAVMLGYSIYRHDLPAAPHIYDGAIAIAHRTMAELCGPGFRALRVQFSHGRPDDLAPFRRVFRTSVVFDAEASGVVFASSWMKRPIEGADPAARAFHARAFQKAEKIVRLSFAEQVSSVLHQEVLGGTVTAAVVAARFGVSERTLRRRLADESTNLQQLIDETRFELARQLLRNTKLTVSEIASALRYADANVFSRAFSRWAKVSPSRWRARGSAAGGTPPGSRMRD